MKSKVQEKEQAVSLRKKGHSYKEILRRVPVAKSSLSLWLKDLPLTKDELRILKKRKNSNITRGRVRAASAIKRNTEKRDKLLFEQASHEFISFNQNPLFFTGLSLYWAEGAKRSAMFQFMNSDEKMISLMIDWIIAFGGYTRKDLAFRLYAHKPYAHENWERWWAKNLQVNESQFKKTIFKLTSLGIKKRPNYKGCLRIEVPRSSQVFKKTIFWTNMMIEYYKKQ